MAGMETDGADGIGGLGGKWHGNGGPLGDEDHSETIRQAVKGSVSHSGLRGRSSLTNPPTNPGAPYSIRVALLMSWVWGVVVCCTTNGTHETVQETRRPVQGLALISIVPRR